MSSTELRPTRKQLRYLRTLAGRAGQTFVTPLTRADASDEIRRLKAVSARRASPLPSCRPSRPPARPTATSRSSSPGRSRATEVTVGGRIRCESARSLLAGILAAHGVAGRGGDDDNVR